MFTLLAFALQASTLNVPARALLPSERNAGYDPYTDSVCEGCGTRYSSGAIGVVSWPILLPAGTVIDRVTAFYGDDDDAAGVHVQLIEHRPGGFRRVVSEAPGVGASAGVSTLTIAGTTMSPDAAYVVEVRLDAPVNGTPMRVFGLQLQWH